MFQFPWVPQQHHPPDKEQLFNNNPDGKTDDVVADDLLSRFPEYGSTTNALLSITSSTGNDNEYYENDDENDDNDPINHHDYNTNVTASDTSYLHGMNPSSKLLWRTQQQQRPPNHDMSHSGDGTSSQGTNTHTTISKLNWWNIPILPGNVPIFGLQKGHDDTKTGVEPMTDSNTTANVIDLNKNNPKGTSINVKKHYSGMSHNHSDINHTQWDPVEQTLWKQRPPQQLPANTAEHVSSTTTTTTTTGEVTSNRRSLSQQQQRQWITDYQNRQAHRTTTSSNHVILSSTFDDGNHHSSSSLTLNVTTTPPRSSVTATSTAGGPAKLLSTLDKKNEASPNQSGSHHPSSWMPDDLCKACADCDVPFTVFRRKHHCRDCGQVFCNPCSSYYVTPTLTVTTTSLDPPSVRVCRTCYDQHGISHKQTLLLSSGIKTSVSLSPIIIGRTTASSSQNEGKMDDISTTHTNQQELLPPPPPPLPTIPLNEQTPKRSHVSVQPQQCPQQGASVQDYQRQIHEGNVHMGIIAANHLELMAHDLLRLHAPLIWNDKVPLSEMSSSANKSIDINPINVKSWVNALLSLATRCCATVSPNVKKGDLLDVRPYVKVKVIPGGSIKDCAYISGVMFRKTVSHKRMAREVLNPKILLLSGGIDFVRNTESRISSLETLFEQEDKYMELLVNKILKLEPDIVLVGRSVNRKAQELLLKANVILIQHVKMTLLNRIARQTNATIVSSTDHHMLNQLSIDVLGTCCRFRLVTFRDNEAWTDNNIIQQESNEKIVAENTTESTSTTAMTPIRPNNDLTSEEETQDAPKLNQRSIQALLADRTLTNHERQAVLAAQRLGETVLDGADAVRAGLAKRGVAHMYVMLEGCPKHLGCTVVLRGANRAALKQLKGVFRFLANCAYNIRLETTYLKERGARLRPGLKLHPANAYSSSLCVDYGQPPDGRKVRPWNGGGKNEATLPRADPSELSPLDHQSILITSVWMTEKTQCCPAEVKGICYYSQQDVALGQFLRDSCFNLSLKCQNPNCKKSVLDHSLSFVHNDGLINIVVSTSTWTIHQLSFTRSLSNTIFPQFKTLIRSRRWMSRFFHMGQIRTKRRMIASQMTMMMEMIARLQLGHTANNAEKSSHL